MKILLEAPILTQSGYGEHSRLVYRALKLLKSHDIFVNPLDWGRTSWLSYSNDDTERQEIEKSIFDFSKEVEKSKNNKGEKVFDMQIHVGIPNEFKKKAPYSICVTAGIETDRVSPEWLMQTHRGIDKIIVPSEHAKDGFEKTSYQVINEGTKTETLLECACPVDVVPYPVKSIEPDHIEIDLKTKFNFLSVALLGPRKNLDQLIRCFIEEFKDESVGLVLKTGVSKGSVMDREETRNIIKKITKQLGIKNRKCKIYLLHGDLSESQIHSLYNREDIHAYVTTSHAEGYGLPIFESAYSGLPVIATDWSGYLDFLQAPYLESGKLKNKKLFSKIEYELKTIQSEAVWHGVLTEDSRWAYPKDLSVKKQMRKVYNNIGMYKKWSNSLKDTLIQTHSVDKVIRKMQEAMFPEELKLNNNDDGDVDVIIL